MPSIVQRAKGESKPASARRLAPLREAWKRAGAQGRQRYGWTSDYRRAAARCDRRGAAGRRLGAGGGQPHPQDWPRPGGRGRSREPGRLQDHRRRRAHGHARHDRRPLPYLLRRHPVVRRARPLCGCRVPDAACRQQRAQGAARRRHRLLRSGINLEHLGGGARRDQCRPDRGAAHGLGRALHHHLQCDRLALADLDGAPKIIVCRALQHARGDGHGGAPRDQGRRRHRKGRR